MKKQQSGGGRNVIGVLETEILDENSNKLLPDGMSEEEADKAEHAWNDVVIYYYFRRQQRKGEFYKPEPDDEEYYAHAYDKYLPYGILVEYDKDDYPALPKGWRTKNGYHVRLVKIHELGPIYDEDPDRDDAAGAAVPDADPNRPIGAGAGPAVPAPPPPPPPPPPPSKKEQEDAASYKQDVEMAGGKKKRRLRSKTRKHKKRHGTRRRY